MARKPIKGKNKSSAALSARGVEYTSGETSPGASRRRVVVKKSPPPKKKIIRSTVAKKSELDSSGKSDVKPPPDKTANVEILDDPEPPTPNVAELPVGKPVDLNDPSVRDDVEQRPLDPSQTQRTPLPKPPKEVLGEPTFKFFCYRCGQKLMVPVSWANKSYPCRRCGHDIVIPPPLS